MVWAREGYFLSDSRRALERAGRGPGGALSVPGIAGPVPNRKAVVTGAVVASRASMFGRSALRNVSALLRVAARPLGVTGAVLLKTVAVGAAARPCGICADLVPGALVAVPEVANEFVPFGPPERVPVRFRW